MTEYTLTLLDTIGIQGYIFGSNRLQENIGASELVYRATSLWAFAALEQAGIERNQHNIGRPENLDWNFRDATIEKDELQAEVIQAAGGNTLILFRDKKKARVFVRVLTLRLLKEAPGLTVLAQHLDGFDFEKTSLPEARLKLLREMQSHKLTRRFSTPTLGLGVTAECASTGLAAVTTLGGKANAGGNSEVLGLTGEDKDELVSSETAAKRAWRNKANERLQAMLAGAAGEFIFPHDLEKLGRLKGEESYVAVIHADGNRMRAHVQEIAESQKENRAYIRAIRTFSQQIEAISRAALETVVHLVVQAVKLEDVPFEEDGKKYLPFRPLVFGGDDVTFVCSGLLGVSLAAEYLEAFEREGRKQGLAGLYASAGVSIVKLHYPFARAYRLSEELAGSAKSLTRGSDCSALDWHFAQSGLSGTLDTIREREYTVEAGRLNLRPLRLEGWRKVAALLEAFEREGWAEKHNKVIGLREPLRKGPEAVKKYLEDFELGKLPEIWGDEASKTGWQGKTCCYLDAIELLDHYVALKDKEAA